MAVINLNYRNPIIRRYADQWFVEYYYRCPADLLEYGFKEWQRFKVYEDINRYKGTEKESYAKLLCEATLIALKDEGYNPFDAIREKLTGSTEPKLTVENRITLITGAELYFNDKLKDNPKSNTLKVYRTTKNLLIDYCKHNDFEFKDVGYFEEPQITEILRYWAKLKQWSNTTFNNNRGHIYTIFYWLHKNGYYHKKLDISMTVERSKSNNSNKFYDGEIRERVNKALSGYPELQTLCQYVYYTCMRNVAELQNIQVKHISKENRTILVPETISKESQRYIPICEELHDLFLKNKVYEASREFFLIGNDGLPALKKVSDNYFNRLYKSNIKVPLELENEYTIYGWKHTRVVDLKLAGYTDAQIQMITGHTSSESYDHYTRGFGLNIDNSLKEKTVSF